MRDERFHQPWCFVNVRRDGHTVELIFPVDDPERLLAGEDLEIARRHIEAINRVCALAEHR